MAKNRGGFPSIFRNKKAGTRYQGVLTKRGSKKFEDARGTLAKLAKRPVERITDADVMEYMARGDDETRDYITQLYTKEQRT